MAIYSCSASVISRSAGRSAVASAAYRAAANIADERQGVAWDFTRKRGVRHSEILLPEDAPDWATDRSRLWNEAELREDKSTRRDAAVVAREFRLALPYEASDEQRVALAREFGQFLVDRYGAAVDFAVHAPDRRGDDRNFHAHVMMTSRQLNADGFTAKIRELDNRQNGGAEIRAIHEAWEGMQNRLLEKLGVDPVSWKTLEAQGLDREATVHMGVTATAMERDGQTTERGDLNREIGERNAERERLKAEQAKVEAQIIDLDAERAKRADQRAIRAEVHTLSPDRIVDQITERRATFTRADLNYHLRDVLPEVKARSAFVDTVLSLETVVSLRETESAPVSRYTSRTVLESENQIIAAADRLDAKGRHGVSAGGVEAALDHYSFLDREQRAALESATQASGFAVIAGEAGTGKSATLSAIREAYETDGYRVLGMAWTNAVVQDMKHDGFAHTSTLAAELMRQNSGRGLWDSRTVLVVDEAGILPSKHLAALMTQAENAGAKVILAGDEKQLASIERGGMFGVLAEKHDAAELHTVRRVRDEDQRTAFNQMHRGEFRAALEIFDRRGAIRWADSPEEAKVALVRQWADDSAADPTKARFVFAYTNAEAADLNQRIRNVRQERGELGEDHLLQTKDGPLAFADGDRVQFSASAATRERKAAGLYNGATGVIVSIEDDRVTVALDRANAQGPAEVSFRVGPHTDAGDFNAIRHGYAGTIYKGQGKTLDQTYLLHSDQWRSASSYVALSRHRDSVKLFVAGQPTPWAIAQEGLAGLGEAQRAVAQTSYEAWARSKPDQALKYGLSEYVAYVQAQSAEDAQRDPLDRLAAQMGRVDERRAASDYVYDTQPREQSAGVLERRPPLSLIASVVGDYLDAGSDWLRSATEDLKRKASARRPEQSEADWRSRIYHGEIIAAEGGGGEASQPRGLTPQDYVAERLARSGPAEPTETRLDEEVSPRPAFRGRDR